MQCSNRKLLIVFEGSAQRERTIGNGTLRQLLLLTTIEVKSLCSYLRKERG